MQKFDLFFSIFFGRDFSELVEMRCVVAEMGYFILTPERLGTILRPRRLTTAEFPHRPDDDTVFDAPRPASAIQAFL